MKTIGATCHVVNGGTPKTGVADYWNGKHRWITPAEMGKRLSPYVSQTERMLSDLGLRNSSAQLLPPHSVIMSSRAPIGHLVINTELMATNQGCKGLIPGRELHHKFLFYYLSSIVDLLNSLGTGATFRELSGGKLKEVAVPVPPLRDQQRIVRLLDEALAGLATAEANAERNLNNTIALFESHLDSVFSRRAEWRHESLGELCEVLDYMRKPVTKRDRKAGKYPYCGATGVLDYVESFIFDEPLVLVGEDGAKWGAGERSAYAVSGKCWVNNHAHVLRPDRKRLLDYWLITWLNHADLSEYVSGLTVPKLNQSSLRSIPIPLPAMPAQQQLAQHAQALEAETQRLTAIYDKKGREIRRLRGSLLHHAFTGQL